MSGGELVGQIADQVLRYSRELDDRIRAEDAISAAAAIAGEACLVTGANLNPDRHDFVPGQAVLSKEVDEILFGTGTNLDSVSPRSVFGVLTASLPIIGASSKDMPALKAVVQNFLKSVGKHSPKSWGWVPLTVPEENRPCIMPLRAAFELRPHTRQLYETRKITTEDRPLVCAGAVARIIGLTSSVLNPRVSLLLASETLIGMSKTAPMSAKHLSELE